MRRFVVIFGLLLVALFTVELLQPVQRGLVQPFTAGLANISAGLIKPFDNEVASHERIIYNTQNQFAVSIEAGCNGVEATIVLIAGILAFPAAWKRKVAAIVAGFFAIQVMNVARIISLFYLGQWDLDIFLWTHLYVWPVLIMLDVLVVFIVYLNYLQRGAQPGAT